MNLEYKQLKKSRKWSKIPLKRDKN